MNGPNKLVETINEIIEADRDRQPAKKTPVLPPGYYDDCDYHYEDEESFGLAEYHQELLRIRRLKMMKKKAKKINE